MHQSKESGKTNSAMKIKQLPEDFSVREITSLEISKEKKPYAIFILEKKGMENFQALAQIARKFKISVREIGYAGLKDKHALTRQYISIPTKYCKKNKHPVHENNLSLKRVGYSDEELKIGSLSGNKFKICIRDIQEVDFENFAKNADSARKYGVPNYYDTQRFGSVNRGDFIAKCLILKDYEKALRIFLQPKRKELSKLKKLKRFLQENWGHWNVVEKHLKESNFKNREIERIVTLLSSNPNDFLGAFKLIRKNLQSMFISTYQSYLWNECAKAYLREIVTEDKLYNVNYLGNDFIFYTELTEEELEKMKAVTIRTISDELVFLDEFEKKITCMVLSKEGITSEQFDIKNETGLFFKTRERKLLLMPDEFSVSEPESDELHSSENEEKRFKITISFELLKGSYATIVIKRILSDGILTKENI